MTDVHRVNEPWNGNKADVRMDIFADFFLEVLPVFFSPQKTHLNIFLQLGLHFSRLPVSCKGLPSIVPFVKICKKIKVGLSLIKLIMGQQSMILKSANYMNLEFYSIGLKAFLVLEYKYMYKNRHFLFPPLFSQLLLSLQVNVLHPL